MYDFLELLNAVTKLLAEINKSASTIIIITSALSVIIEKQKKN